LVWFYYFNVCRLADKLVLLGSFTLKNNLGGNLYYGSSNNIKTYDANGNYQPIG
jgi:hypothetical protein